MDATGQAWTGHPLGGALLRFNLLPSRLFHPDRRDEWLPPQARPLGESDAVHRHASRGLLRRLGLGLVRDLEDPRLPLCMATDSLFALLLRCCGLVPLGPALRRVIARAEVAALEAQLGDFGLGFARRAAPQLWITREPACELDAQQASAQADRLGSAVLAQAFAPAPPDIARRACLRLPQGAEAARAELPRSLDESEAALQLARSVLQELDPAWLSSFPAPR